MAIHFIPNPNNLPAIHHKNDNKEFNHWSNLEWITFKENSTRAAESGCYEKGEQREISKLTKNAVLEIRSSDIPVALLANKYNVNISTIYKAKNNETWKHI